MTFLWFCAAATACGIAGYFLGFYEGKKEERAKCNDLIFQAVTNEVKRNKEFLDNQECCKVTPKD